MNVLFLSIGNSCRSIMAEAIFNHLARPGWHAMSAGIHSAGTVHPATLQTLARHGIGHSGYYSKSCQDLPMTPVIVVALCERAANEPVPECLGPALVTCWEMPDPSQARGADAEVQAAFEQGYQTLRTKIDAFLALPLGDLAKDLLRLKAQLDHIGLLSP